MNRLDTILEREQTNTDRIFIYVLNGQFMVFGCSAYYAVLLCPKLIVNRSSTDTAGTFVCIYIPDDYLRLLSKKCPTLADDRYIRVVPPLNICRQQDGFEEWQKQQLHLASEIDIE